MGTNEVSKEELVDFINIVKELDADSFRLIEHDAKLLRLRDATEKQKTA